MKSACIVILLVFTGVLAYGQSQDVEIIKKEEPGRVILSAWNKTTTDLDVELTIESTGLDLSVPAPVTRTVKAGSTVELVTMTSRPGTKWSYRYHLKYMSSKGNQTEQPAEPDSKPVIRRDAEQEEAIYDPMERIAQPLLVPDEVPRTDNRNARLKADDVKVEEVTLPSEHEIFSNSGIVVITQPGCPRSALATERLSLYRVPFEKIEVTNEREFSEMVESLMSFTGVQTQAAAMPVFLVDGQPHYEVKDLDAFTGRLVAQFGSEGHIRRDVDITLFIKPGCTRCATAKQFLKEINVPYREIDVTKSSKEVNAMWSVLSAQGHTGPVITPVVLADGEYYYQIPDIRAFLSKLVER